MKWNTNTSLNTLFNKSTIGGILKNNLGQFCCIFSSPIPLIEIDHAEILAIHRVIKIFSSSKNLGQYGLIIESDSGNVVKWCNCDDMGPWNLTFIINSICNTMSSEEGISIIYKERATNMVVDALAKQGLLRMDEFVV